MYTFGEFFKYSPIRDPQKPRKIGGFRAGAQPPMGGPIDSYAPVPGTKSNLSAAAGTAIIIDRGLPLGYPKTEQKKSDFCGAALYKRYDVSSVFRLPLKIRKAGGVPDPARHPDRMCIWRKNRQMKKQNTILQLNSSFPGRHGCVCGTPISLQN